MNHQRRGLPYCYPQKWIPKRSAFQEPPSVVQATPLLFLLNKNTSCTELESRALTRVSERPPRRNFHVMMISFNLTFMLPLFRFFQVSIRTTNCFASVSLGRNKKVRLLKNRIIPWHFLSKKSTYLRALLSIKWRLCLVLLLVLRMFLVLRYEE